MVGIAAMPIRSTRFRSENTPDDHLVREYVLIRPNGHWHRMRFPTRIERLRRFAGVTVLMIISLALWAVHMAPLYFLILAVRARLGGA